MIRSQHPATNRDSTHQNDLGTTVRGLLTTFSDPAFQILLRKTQLHAAATSEQSDHELLAKLLSERAGEPSKPMHMVVTRAVEVVEQIDPESLTGMMFLWFVTNVGPSLPDPKSGLASLDKLISKLLAGGELPTGIGWLQRLDLMNCIHSNPSMFQIQTSPSMVQTSLSMFHTESKWQASLTASQPGYVCEGVLPGDADAIRLRLNRVIPNLGSILVEHPFLPGRFRINAINSADLLNVLDSPLEILRQAKNQIPLEALEQLRIEPLINALGTKEELQRILIEAKIDTVSAEASDNMLRYVEAELPNLQKLRSWWENIVQTIVITPLGIAIAFSNAKRFDEFEGLNSLSDMIGAS